MKVYGLWGGVNIQGKGKGNLVLGERMGCYWIALYEEPFFKDSFQEEVDIAVDALKENPGAAAGAVLTVATYSAVKAVAVALGADRGAMRRTPGFENESAKEFSQTLAKSRKTAARKRLLFETELGSLTSCSHFGNTVSMVLDCTYRLTFENPKS